MLSYPQVARLVNGSRLISDGMQVQILPCGPITQDNIMTKINRIMVNDIRVGTLLKKKRIGGATSLVIILERTETNYTIEYDALHISGANQGQGTRYIFQKGYEGWYDNHKVISF